MPVEGRFHARYGKQRICSTLVRGPHAACHSSLSVVLRAHSCCCILLQPRCSRFLLPSRRGRAGGAPDQDEPAAASAPEKVVVFSQWTRMLDLVGRELAAARIRFGRLDGSMSVAAREAAIGTFTASPRHTS